MGNLLTSDFRPHIQDTGNYLDGLNGVKLHKIICRSRFLKTLHGRMIIPELNDNLRSYESQKHLTDVVIKVFHLNNISPEVILPFKAHLERQAQKLEAIPQCRPYHVLVLGQRAAFMVRQYFHMNLNERLFTRPFLTFTEKLWLSFQILQALKSIHEVNVIHGDLKMENIMLTTWNWITLVDFSTCYKPILLDMDNPLSDYDYFYDTSRRNCCTLAPERFIAFSKTSNENTAKNTYSTETYRPLSSVDYQMWLHDPFQEMDMFSFGCILYEIFSEGRILFDFNSLLQYKFGILTEEAVHKKIDCNIKTTEICDIVKRLISLSPENRGTAESYLNNYKSTLFPESFYTIFYSLYSKYALTKCSQTDSWIIELDHDIGNILSTENISIIDMTLALPLATSNCRRLQTLSAKKVSFKLLESLSDHLSPIIVLERVLPYLCNFFYDKDDRVQGIIPSYLFSILNKVDTIDSSEDGGVFLNYIIPRFFQNISKTSISLQINLVANLTNLVKLVFKFHDLTQNTANEEIDERMVKDSREFSVTDESLVHQKAAVIMLKNLIISLISEQMNSVVKRILFDKSILVVHGILDSRDIYKDANDMFPYLISILNDSSGDALKETFFTVAEALVPCLKQDYLDMLFPFVEQGLWENNCWVNFCSLKLAARLIRYNRHTFDIGKFIRFLAKYLVHPNPALRGQVVDCISGIQKNIEDYHHWRMFIWPFIKDFVLSECYFKESFLDSVMSPLSWKVFKICWESREIEKIFDHLESKLKSGVTLLSKGFTEESNLKIDENDPVFNFSRIIDSTVNISHLLHFRNLIMNYNNLYFRRSTQQERRLLNGSVILTKNNTKLIKCINLKSQQNVTVSRVSVNKINRMSPKVFEGTIKRMFEFDDKKSNQNILYAIYKDTNDSFSNNIINRMSYTRDFEEDHTRSKYVAKKPTKKVETSGDIKRCDKMYSMQNHSKSVNSICFSSKGNFLATTSSDGSLVLMKYSPNAIFISPEVILTYDKAGSRIKKGILLENNLYVDNYVAISCIDSSAVQVVQYDGFVTNQYFVDYTKEGYFTDIATINMPTFPILLGSTLKGSIYGYDLRCKKGPNSLEFRNLKGSSWTSIVPDPGATWIACGDSKGEVSLFDVRFGLCPVLEFQTSGYISKLSSNPTNKASVISAHSLGKAALNIHDLSSASLLHQIKTQVKTSTCGLTTCFLKNHLNIIFSSSDKSVSAWNIDKPDLLVTLISDNYSNFSDLSSSAKILEDLHITEEKYEAACLNDAFCYENTLQPTELAIFRNNDRFQTLFMGTSSGVVKTYLVE